MSGASSLGRRCASTVFRALGHTAREPHEQLVEMCIRDSLKTTYEQLNEKKKIETKNFYSIYRGANDKLTEALKRAGGSVFADMHPDNSETLGGVFGLDMNRYDVAAVSYTHLDVYKRQIEASEFGGGFAGVERNGQLVGALDKVGVDLLTQLGELIKKTKTQSLLLDCKLMQGATVRAKQYAGGISGCLLYTSRCV